MSPQIYETGDYFAKLLVETNDELRWYGIKLVNGEIELSKSHRNFAYECSVFKEQRDLDNLLSIAIQNRKAILDLIPLKDPVRVKIQASVKTGHSKFETLCEIKIYK